MAEGHLAVFLRCLEMLRLYRGCAMFCGVPSQCPAFTTFIEGAEAPQAISELQIIIVSILNSLRRYIFPC